MACVQGFDRVQTLVYAKVGVFLFNTFVLAPCLKKVVGSRMRDSRVRIIQITLSLSLVH
jgi:hypothetical protein